MDHNLTVVFIRKFEYRHKQMESNMKTQGEDKHLQAKERALEGSFLHNPQQNPILPGPRSQTSGFQI